jgi:ATP-binding cassette subfamily G (WHITE) protein 2 (SNQ2)
MGESPTTPVTQCANDGYRETEIEGRTFTWEKVDYTVPVPGGIRRLLHDVYGYVKPGTMTVLMGSSGAGKTTCLDVLA